jgi:hypothetical protein
MQPTPFSRLLFVAILSAASIFPSVTFAAKKSHKSSVRFLARGTAIYSSFSGSQSEYLVQIQSSKQAPFLARLLYRRPLQHPEIPDDLIDSGGRVYLRLVRAAECDQSYETLSTRWLPGDGGALQAHDGLRFISAHAMPTIAASEELPCYQLSQREIRWKRHYQRAE